MFNSLVGESKTSNPVLSGAASICVMNSQAISHGIIKLSIKIKAINRTNKSLELPELFGITYL